MALEGEVIKCSADLIGLAPSLKKDPRELFPPLPLSLCQMRHGKKMARRVLSPDTKSASTFTLDISLQNCEKYMDVV